MKTKVSQKEWNDARDKFLCAMLVESSTIWGERLERANLLTSELYEVEESRDLLKWKANAEENFITTPISVLRYISQLEQAIGITNEEEQPTITDKVTAQVDIMHQAAIELKEAEDHIPNVGNKVEDTRPFNPKVVEIFNEFLPKEIAPLAIEAHKLSCGRSNGYNVKAGSLENALYEPLCWDIAQEIGDFGALYNHTYENTITATPEQLREWFPQAYEGGENE